MYGYINKKSWKARPWIFFSSSFFMLMLLTMMMMICAGFAACVSQKEKEIHDNMTILIIIIIGSLDGSVYLYIMKMMMMMRWESSKFISTKKYWILSTPSVRTYLQEYMAVFFFFIISSSPSIHHHHHIIIQRSSRTKNHQCFYSIQPIRPFHPLLFFDKTFILLFFLISQFFSLLLSQPALTLLSCYSSSFSWWSWSSSSSRQIFNYGGCTSKTYIIDSSSRFLFLRLTE